MADDVPWPADMNEEHTYELVPLHVLDAAEDQITFDPWDLPPPSSYAQPNTNPVADTDEDEARSSWAPVDLAALFAGDYNPPTPSLFTRNDGQAILYEGKAHAFNGPPESGKSWAALTACVQTINNGQNALYVDFEDTAPTVVTRLLALGAQPDAVVQHLTYLCPSEPLFWQHKVTVGGLEFSGLLEHRQFTLAVVDGVTEAMNVHGLDTNSNNDAATYYGMLPRKLQRTGAATVQIDHKPKNNRDNPTRGGIGAQHKLAGIDVSYRFDVRQAFGVGQHGIAAIVIEKDRPGQLRQHAAGPQHDRLAEFHLINTNGALQAELRPLEIRGHDGATWEPTTLMERVAEFVSECNENHQYPSQRMIEDGVTGKGEHIRHAIAALVKHGNLTRGGADKPATGHTLLAPYKAPKDD